MMICRTNIDPFMAYCGHQVAIFVKTIYLVVCTSKHQDSESLSLSSSLSLLSLSVTLLYDDD